MPRKSCSGWASADGDEEPRLAAADLDLERSGAAETRARVERLSDPELLVRPAREASR